MRSRPTSTFTSLAGSLLLAHPSLQDSNFRRSVILMSAHDAEGAMGVVLNRPAGRRLAQLSGDFALGPLADVPVYLGGPVEMERLMLAAWQSRDDGFQLHFGLEPDKARELLEREGVHLRGFLGYSGWSAGQLDGELARDTWVVEDVPEDLLDHPQNEVLWRKILGRKGGRWRLLADEPDELRWN
jgi:putative transcriptional regulator